MPSQPSSVSVSLLALFALGTANAADFECPIAPEALPHESWDAPQLASSSELHWRIYAGLGHWSHDPGLQLAVSAALAELLGREPGVSRGYVEYARFAHKYARLSNLTLAPDVYDFVERMLATAIELDPESASAWAFEGRFRQYRRGFYAELGNGKPYMEALDLADRYGPENPDVVLALADAPMLMFEHEQVVARLNELLAAGDLPAFVTTAALRRLVARYTQMGRLGAAERAAEDAIEAERGNPDNWLEHAAFVLEQRVDPERALESALTADCIVQTEDSDRLIALILYAAWATDNAGSADPSLNDARIVEAFERLPNVAEVMSYFASHERLAPLVEVFVEAGLSADVQDPRSGLTMLFHAVQDGRLADAARLIELGADVNLIDERFGSPLMEATLRRDEPMVRLLLESGADVNAKSLPYGTALFNSLIAIDYDIAERLLEAGADPNLTNLNGETALGFAAFAYDDPEQRLPFIELLLAHGANPDVEIRPGQSLIDATIELMQPGVTALLRQALRDREEVRPRSNRRVRVFLDCRWDVSDLNQRADGGLASHDSDIPGGDNVVVYFHEEPFTGLGTWVDRVAEVDVGKEMVRHEFVTNDEVPLSDLEVNVIERNLYAGHVVIFNADHANFLDSCE